MILNTTYDPQTSAPVACSGPGAKFFTDIAHAIAGTDPPPCEPPDRSR